VSDHLRQDITLIVTDIATLDTLLHGSTSFVAHVVQNARKLAITFNLPIDVLTAIELRSTGWSVHALPKDRSNKRAMDQAASWLRAGPALGRLEKLTKCDFWLVADLPSHAADDVSTPPFKIYRRQRQEWFGVNNSAGRFSVIRKDQFPVMGEIVDYVKEMDDNEEEKKKIGRMFDAQEREMWRKGEDVQDYLRMLLAEMDPLWAHRGNI
jgi:hypothetical protein